MRGHLTAGGRVAEIGQQQLSDDFLRADELIDSAYRAFGRPRIPLGNPVGPENFAERAPLSRPFWQSLGFDYLAVDLIGDDIVGLNLNSDAVPGSLLLSQDLAGC